MVGFSSRRKEGHHSALYNTDDVPESRALPLKPVMQSEHRTTVPRSFGFMQAMLFYSPSGFEASGSQVGPSSTGVRLATKRMKWQMVDQPR